MAITDVKELEAAITARDPDQKEFLQAVNEVLETLAPVVAKKPELLPILQRLCEPERQLMFRVPWVNDAGEVQVNRGFRVQFSSAIGPYKGGLRFHPTVNLSIIKFLGFEQTFKNSLTTVPLGGGKGGSDFDPKGKSDNEVMRFCQSFMTELYRHIGADTDVPAGDIGVGGREVGFLFGQYKRLSNQYTGILTGKGLTFGGSLLRPEATGYGTVYMGEELLKGQSADFKGKRSFVSGSGNVALFAALKLLELGAVVLTLSDSGGYILAEDGLTPELLAKVFNLKDNLRGRLSSFSEPGVKFVAGAKPWGCGVPVDVALPCATQNEVGKEDAEALVAAGCKMVLEGANMPSTSEAIDVFHGAGVVYMPGKAANAGGVAVSGLEMEQNSCRRAWSKEEVDVKLRAIMQNICQACQAAAKEYNTTLQAGANIAGFLKVAEAMQAQGVV